MTNFIKIKIQAKEINMIVKIQNQIFNMTYVKYLMKVDGKDGKHFIGVFTNIENDKEFYFEYPSAQRRNEDWDRIDRDLSISMSAAK